MLSAVCSRAGRDRVDFNAVFTRGQVPWPKVRAFVDFLVEVALRHAVADEAAPEPLPA